MFRLEELFLEEKLETLKKMKPEERVKLVKRRLQPKPFFDVALRVERLSGKCLVEKDGDLILNNLTRVLYALMANYENYDAPSITVTGVDGVDRTGPLQHSLTNAYPRQTLGWVYAGGSGDDARGILIGQGTTPPARTDYTLESQITHGTGAGQISHLTQTYELLSDYQFRLNREFVDAGSDLNVSEAGLVYMTRIGGANVWLLLLRDTFEAVPVATGNGLRARYTFTF